MNLQETVVLEIGCIKVNETIEYYNQNAKDFCESTISADMSEFLNKSM